VNEKLKKKNGKEAWMLKHVVREERKKKKKVCFCTIATAHRMQNKNEIALKA
jgi:hypothetical protein